MAEGYDTRYLTDAHGKSLLAQLHPDCLMLVLARHGQRGGPRVDGLAGKTLTPLGHRQAQRLAKRVTQLPLNHIYCSDMARAYQTAEPIRALRPQLPFDVLPDLRELSIYDQPDYLPDLTEERRWQLHHERIGRVAQRLRTCHKPGEVVLIVAHGGMNRYLLAALSGVPMQDMLHQHHASITVASISAAGQVHIRLSNCTRHLPPTWIN